MFTNRDERRLNSDTEDTEDTEEQKAHKKRTSGQAALKAPNNKRRGAVVVGPEEPLISDLLPGKQTLDFINSYRQFIDKIRAYVDKLVNYVKDHMYGAYDIPLQISAHLLSRLAAVQDVLKLNSGTELLHAFQSARAELSSTGPAPFDQFVSLIPQDKRGNVLRGGRGRWTYDYVMQEIDHLIQMSSRMSPDMSSSMSAWLNPAKPEPPIFSRTTAASPAGPPSPVKRPSRWPSWLSSWPTTRPTVDWTTLERNNNSSKQSGGGETPLGVWGVR